MAPSTTKKSPAGSKATRKAAAKTKAAASKKAPAKSKPSGSSPAKAKQAAAKSKAKAKATPKAKAKAKPKAQAKAKAKTAGKAKPAAKAKASPQSSANTAKRPTKKQSPAKQSRGSSQSRMDKTQKAAAKTAPVKPATRTTADSPFKNFTPYEPKKNEKYMSEEQLAHFKAILLKWRRELMEEVDRTVHHMRDEAANFPDPADRATQEEEFSIELRTRDRERKLIKKIDQTIDRLDQHDFGYCDTCGVEIGLRRLEARPTATQCVDCKALDEIKERQLHG